MAVAGTYKIIKEEMEERIQFVADEIGRDWKKLGRELKIASTAIDNIDHDVKYTEEKALEVLTKWYKKNGSFGATNEVLCKALQRIGHTSIAEALGYPPNGTCPETTEPDSYQNFEHKLDDILKSCQDMISRCSSDCAALVSNKQRLQDLKVMNKILMEATQPENIEKKKVQKEREQHIEQTICLIESLLEKNSKKCSSNSYENAIKNIEHKLDDMLKSCQDMISCCPSNCTALVFNKQRLQDLKALNKILMEATQPENVEKSKVQRDREQHTEQTICLIENLLKQNSTRCEVRPVSQILPRCTSLVILPPRSDTFSGTCGILGENDTKNRNGSRESSPIHHSICEEDDKEQSDVKDEPPQITRCESCGSCLNFNVKKDSLETASENQDIERDENENQMFKPVVNDDETTTAEHDETTDSKL